jgi:putative DNA-invertase from lambdoid prophage Rac
MKAAIYARVSTLDQACDMQLAELRQYCGARGWEIAGEYVDTGFSGKIANRPALKRCLADAKKRTFDALLVWRLDRWGRTVAQLSADILALDSAGVRFVCPGQGIDTDQSNSMSRLLINILSAFAQFERDVIQERVVAGVRHAQTHGTKSGRDFGRPKKVFNRQEIIDMRATGASLSAIVAATGISKTTVRRVIAN